VFTFSLDFVVELFQWDPKPILYHSILSWHTWKGAIEIQSWLHSCLERKKVRRKRRT